MGRAVLVIDQGTTGSTAMIVDEKLLPTGGHNFKTFRKYIPPVIHWMSTHLQGE